MAADVNTAVEAGPGPWRGVLRLQPAVWGLLGLLYFALDRGRQPEDPTWFLALRSLVWALIGGVIGGVLCRVYARLRAERWSLLRVSALIPASSVTAGLLWLGVFSALESFTDLEGGWLFNGFSTEQLFSELMNYSLALVAWHAAVFFLAQRADATQTARRLMQVELEARQAQLDALRMQLRPHFLFNAINSVVSLIDLDPAKAQSLLIELSEILRAVLASSEGGLSTVGRELSILERYLHVESVRYGDQLRVDVQVDPGCRGRSLPALILLPLVDNAVKHGMAGAHRPLDVRLQLSPGPDGGLVAEVKNQGSLRPSGAPPPGIGAGLPNVAQRAEAEGGSLQLFEQPGADGGASWVVARLQLPSLATLETLLKASADLSLEGEPG